MDEFKDNSTQANPVLTLNLTLPLSPSRTPFPPLLTVMNLVNGAGPPGPQLVKKLEAIDDRGSPGGKDIKPVKTTLNRVPRSSEAVSALVGTPSAHLTPTVLLSRCLRESPRTRALPSSPLILCSTQNACRKQKMRCEGAENPPCKRCRQQSLDCLFEKPNREASLTGEAGLEYAIVPFLHSHASFIVLDVFGAWRPTLSTYDNLRLPFKIPSWKSSITCARGQQG